MHEWLFTNDFNTIAGMAVDRMATDSRAVGERLKRTREALGYEGHGGQAIWCRFVGITPQAWNNYESGLNRISLDQAFKVCAATGVTLDWIYFGDRSGLPVRIASQLAEFAQKKAQ
jgi:transcriptional regulator with XRE-family HTH domain